MAALFLEGDNWTDISDVLSASDSSTIIIQNIGSYNIFTSESILEPGDPSEVENLRKIPPGGWIESYGRAAGVKLWGIAKKDRFRNRTVRYSAEIDNA